MTIILRHIMAATIAFTFILSLPVPKAQAQTVDEYLLIERGDMPNVRPEFNLPLLLGVMEGLAAFGDAALINDVRFFCVPSASAVLNFDDFKKQVDKLLYELERERIDFIDYAKQTSIGTIGLKVLIQAYPCGTAQ